MSLRERASDEVRREKREEFERDDDGDEEDEKWRRGTSLYCEEPR